jgi:hypothetical protein
MTPDSPAIHASPPVPGDKDAEHLKLLAIFQFILGAFALLGTGFLAFHYLMMQRLFTDPEFSKPPHRPPPEVFMDIMVWVYVILGGYFVVSLVANVVCGVFLLKRKFRGLCMMAAVLQCFMVPLGTLLGVFTIMVLNRPSVQAKFTGSPSS